MRQKESHQAQQVDLSGCNYLVTGGSSGIGAEIVKSLSRWGAQVMIACRSREKGNALRSKIEKENSNAQIIVFPDADTSNLESMKSLIERLIDSQVTSIDGLILNAGIAERPYSLSKQGVELHCATNVLGHHLLVRGLLPLVAASRFKRIIGVTGDIYVFANNCTLDYRYRINRTLAYSRSKLGALWNALTLHELKGELGHPDVVSVAVHPGVVATDLIRGFDGIKRKLFISPISGAQPSLTAATDGGVSSGSYLHNTRGFFTFYDDDPAMNCDRRRAFWNECEEVIRHFLS